MLNTLLKHILFRACLSFPFPLQFVVLDSTETVLAGYEPEHSTIIKVAMHRADIIDMDNAALCSVRDRMRIMTHMV